MLKLIIKFTAEQAHESTRLPSMLMDIEDKIRIAASNGIGGVDITGKLPFKIHVALRDAGYEMTWKSECNSTWIYWGN